MTDHEWALYFWMGCLFFLSLAAGLDAALAHRRISRLREELKLGKEGNHEGS
jgi:hypothetical protein